MANRVFVTLDVKDQGTKVFQGFAKLVDQTGDKLDQMGGKGKTAFSGMQGAVAGGVLQANLLADALYAGVNAAQSLGASVVGAFREAAQIQLDNVGLAADISSITGEAFSATREELRNISKEVERAGNAFPVADEMIAEASRGFLDDIHQANESRGKGIEAITQDAADLLPRIAVMAEKSNFSASEAARFSSQFINGQLTEAQLKNLDFFNRNKLFMKTVGDYLQQSGKELKSLSQQELYNLYQAGLNAQVTDDYVKEAGKTLKGIWNSFTGVLFGENFGIFSLVRDLEEGVVGDQSVIAAASDTLYTLFGQEGIIPTLGGILASATGLTDKSLLNALREGFLGLNEWLSGIKNSLTLPKIANIPEWFSGQLEALLSKGAASIRSVDFRSVARGIYSLFGSLLDNASDGLQSIDPAQLGGFFNSLLEGGKEALLGIDYNALGQQWGRFTAEAFNLLGNTIISIDWSQVPPILLRAAIGSISLLAGFLGSAVTSFDWSMPVRGFFSLFVNLFGSLGGMIQVGWESLDSSIHNVFNRAGQWVTDQASNLIRAAAGLFDRINSFFQNLINRFPGVNISIPRAPAPMAVGVDSKAGGHFPSNFANGLLRAASQEASRMPSGASVVVANSSEAILNQAQQRAFAGAVGGRSGDVSLVIQNLTIEAGNRDAQSLAQQVIQAINQQFQAYSRSKLSSLAV